MSVKIQIKREKRGQIEVARISGPVNEEAGIHFIQLYEGAGPRWVFNFRDVSSINSFGIRAWTLFLRDFQGDREIELEECPPVIVDQINMLPSFTYKAKVKSVYVPYECPSCTNVTNVLMEERDFPRSPDEVKPGRCKKCMTPTDALDLATYFQFAWK